MRQKLVDLDLLDCVLGLGPNLFYNSPMEACVVVCRNSKPPKRRGQVIFIDAVNEVTRERSMSYLAKEHQDRIANAYHEFEESTGFTKVASLDEIHRNDGNLSIPLYVRGNSLSEEKGEYKTNGIHEAVQSWEESSKKLATYIDELFNTLQ